MNLINKLVRISKLTERINSPEWQRAVKASDKEVDDALKKLHEDSKVDPKLLDEPADI